MLKTSVFAIVVSALLAIVSFSGCEPAAKNPGKGNATQAGKHDHEHGHEHGHDHDHASKGPNGGKIIELGEEEYHVEWLTNDESGNVKLVLLDKDMKKEVPTTAAEATITTKVGDKENAYKLAATNASTDEKPAASRFEVDDKSLVAALKAAGKGVDAKLVIDVNGKPFTAKIELTEHKH